MATIRVRVNPTDTDQYVIYADADDRAQPWIAQSVGGTWLGWEYRERVAGWPEFELRIPAAQ